jgi:hypothetical protein
MGINYDHFLSNFQGNEYENNDVNHISIMLLYHELNNLLNKLHSLFHAEIYLDHTMFFSKMLKYLEFRSLLYLHFDLFSLFN